MKALLFLKRKNIMKNSKFEINNFKIMVGKVWRKRLLNVMIKPDML
jgi:hypothetical protein